MINTLNKQIKAEAMGITMYHEHLTIDLSEQKNDPDARLEGEALLQDLKEIKKAGVRTIVELTNIGMGRDVERLRSLADQLGFNIVASTGFYKEPYLPDFFYQKTKQELVELMVSEIKDGIDGTDIKAGVIGEVGTSQKITAAEKKLLQAAALAQKETGVPIITHLTLGSCGLEQLEILENAGADLTNVALSHLDLADDIDYVLELAARGVFIGIDTIGKLKYQSDQFRIKLIKALLKAGFKDQILISTDITRMSHLKANGGHSYQYLLEEFIPKLKAAAVSEEEIEGILINNPAKLFS
ncbi:phosphotriesterase-related protein [Halanaerobium saccharolyticum]|uniref:Phosphotriesterase-related protein n=1 Tax=Halanaerobium saccharolyticum TaxID=43595 RepID=A0A4R6M1H3_9FIRM|nr:phosphotriesterase-related protein [Halanaerobium saccharolyticum]TDO94210.1 phosphotriesterase-related protein [Halanaerobium saccharolyticum]